MRVCTPGACVKPWVPLASGAGFYPHHPERTTVCTCVRSSGLGSECVYIWSLCVCCFFLGRSQKPASCGFPSRVEVGRRGIPCTFSDLPDCVYSCIQPHQRLQSSSVLQCVLYFSQQGGEGMQRLQWPWSGAGASAGAGTKHADLHFFCSVLFVESAAQHHLLSAYLA